MMTIGGWIVLTAQLQQIVGPHRSLVGKQEAMPATMSASESGLTLETIVRLVIGFS